MNSAPQARILIVDDEEAQMKALCDTLRDGGGYETVGFSDSRAALAALRETRYDLLLSDLMMPEMDGITLLRMAQETDPNLLGIIMTGQGTIASAVEAMKTGAFDYILKPFKLSVILPVLSRALAVRQLRLENISLQEGLRQRSAELEAAQQQLMKTNAELERRVEERTAALRDYAGKLRRLSHRLFETEEIERRRLARELHDSIGQNLTVLNMTVGMIRAGLPADAREQVSAHLGDCEALLQTTGDLVRDVMADLRPPGLDELGLLAALTGYARQTGSRGRVPIAVSGAEIAPRLPPTAEIALFRIAQEAIVNALKHAGATGIALTLESRPDAAIMVIADNGFGFDPAVQRSQATAHLGLVNMRERTQSIGGQLRVESAPGRGTRVIVEAPRVAPALSDQPHLPGLESA